MPDIADIHVFYSQLMDEVSHAKDAETYGWDDSDFFTSVMLEYLEEAGEAENIIICPFKERGVQLNAYSVSEDFETINLYVSIFEESLSLKSVTESEIKLCINRAVLLYRKAVAEKLYSNFRKDNDAYEFAVTLHDNRESIGRVNVVILTNGSVKSISLKRDEIEDSINITKAVWDIERLFRCVSSGKMREVIEIDFEETFGTTIPCIENDVSSIYSVYLAVLDGNMLAALYEEHGARLLERNVRSYLQAKGDVNRGMRDTLRSEPDMFIAYNNGISVIAEEIGIVRDENGKPSIKMIRDMQIVNGGQTTVSIYNATKDKALETGHLSNASVQMKLTVLKSPSDMDKYAPKISRCANMQNKIQTADFSANDPFHKKMEELSRVIWAPAQDGQKPRNWFYERSRGQYTDMLSRESTDSKKRNFKETHPLFTKTDLAKFENTWEQLPHQVSEGPQKNFRKFTIRLNERGKFLPDEGYYKRMIAKAIMFKRAEKLINALQHGGYRAKIVTYALAFLSYKTSQRIDLYRIWKEQRLTDALESEIIKVAKLVQQYIVEPPDRVSVSDWSKRQKCWDIIKELDYKISPELHLELVFVDRTENVVSKTASAHSELNMATDEEQIVIDKAKSIPASTWFALSKWAKETNNFQGWQRSLLFTIGTLIGRNKTPSFKQANHAVNAYEEAIVKGFVFKK